MIGLWLAQVEAASDGATGPADAAQLHREQMKQTISDVLASPQFGEMDDARDEWARRFVDWLRSLFSSAGEAVDSLPEWALWTLIIICSLIVLALLLHAIYTAVIALRQSRGSKPFFEKEAQPAGELLGIAELDAGAIAKQARAFLMENKAEPALRYFYAAMILRLDQMRRLRYRPANTNRDYLRELPAHDPSYPAFSRITRAFEEAVYARQGAMLDDCRFADDALADLEKEVRTA
jgi:hypothetical protein